MSLSNRLASYPDVRQALDMALTYNGGRIRFTTRGKAYYWKARANHYKALLARETARTTGGPAESPYDALIIRIDPRNDNWIEIELRAFTQVFETPEGEVVTPPTTPGNAPPISVGAIQSSSIQEDPILSATDDEITAAALEVRNRIFGEES